MKLPSFIKKGIQEVHLCHHKSFLKFICFAFFLLFSLHIWSVDPQDALQSLIKSTVKNELTQDEPSFLTLKNQLRIIGFLTFVSLIPFGVMMLTSFTRISIIFQFIRQAIGASQIPSNQIIIGLSIILTGFVMQPVIQEIYKKAITPYMSGSLKNFPEVESGKKTEEQELLELAWQPLRNFLLAHIREKDLELFLEIAHENFKTTTDPFTSAYTINNLDDVPWYCIVPAFMISELRTAFMMGFILFLPFLIIDMTVAAVLMSMGMMMLPPIMISMPFKLLLFIMIDGWRLIVYQLIKGFYL